MNRSWIKLSLLLVATLAAAPAVFGQGWPLPAKTSNTPVPCPPTSNACVGFEGKLTAPYSDPIKTFVGRYLDSQSQGEHQDGFRTARARRMQYNPTRNVVYMIIGSALFEYDMSKLITRLNGGEAMVPITLLYGQAGHRGPYPETILTPDGRFYAEGATKCSAPNVPEGCWYINNTDGQDRLFGFDFDDRNYVYVAYNPYGFGILHDSPSSPLESIWQAPDGPGVLTPNRVVSVKASTGYYVVVSPDSGSVSNLYYVGDANTLAHDKRTDLRLRITSFAKASNNHIATVEADGKLRVYTNDGLVAGAASQEFSAPQGIYYDVDTDGTNFYGLSESGVGGTSPTNAVVTILSYNGTGYSASQVDLGYAYGSGPMLRCGDGGYVMVFGSESYLAPAVSGRNLRMYKVSGTSLSPVPLKTGAIQPAGSHNSEYFVNYYMNDNALNYTAPQFSGLDGGNPGSDARIFKFGGKSYLFIAAIGLGDIYEISAGDSITAKVKQIGHSANSSAAGLAGPGPFYGDEITFTSTSTAAAPPSVIWTFEGDPTAYPHTSANPDVPYQWGNLTNNSFVGGPVTRTATVTVDSNTSDHTSVQIRAPQIRLGISGHPELLFTQPDVSSSAPIVTSDNWLDASDGALESHFTTWKIDGTPTNKVPNQLTSVGPCGPHTLVFTTHYGPNLAQNNPPSFIMVSTEATYSIDPYTYTVLPFTLNVSDPIKDPGNAANILFSASIRTTTSTTDLPAGSATPATFTWSVLNSDGSPTGVTQTSTATLGAPPSFSVAKSSFGSSSKQVQLKVDIAPSATACTGFATQTRTTGNLTGPSGVITVTGCQNFHSQCTVSFPVNPAWHYAWTISGGTPGTAGDGANFAAFSPNFPSAGPYTISLTVENAIGIFSAQPVNITLAQPVCASDPKSGQTVASFYASPGGSGCASFADTCFTTDTINFFASAQGWNKDTCDTLLWDFGDASPTSTLAQPTHTYSNPGTYTISLTYTGGLSSVTVTNVIHVGTGSGGGNPPPGGGGGNPPPGGGGPPAGCSTLTNSSVYIGFNGSTSNCTPNFGNCNANEGIIFSAGANPPYNLGCTTHNYTWNFGDGQTSNDAAPTHFYLSAGNYTVTLTVSNQTQVATITAPIKVGSVTSGGSCPPLNLSNVSPAYSSGNPNCHLGGTCNANEAISFHVDLVGNAAGCTITNYTWTFGKSDTVSHDAAPTFTFATAGDYDVTVAVSNAQTTTPVTSTIKVHVGTVVGNCPEMTTQNVYYSYFGSDTQCSPIFGECKDTEQVNFSVYGTGYSFGCSTHTFTWDFGDGSAVEATNSQNTAHKFRGGGSFDVELTITNTAGGSITLHRTVKVLGTALPGRPRPVHH